MDPEMYLHVFESLGPARIHMSLKVGPDVTGHPMRGLSKQGLDNFLLADVEYVALDAQFF